jgi:hypothetical protein
LRTGYKESFGGGRAAVSAKGSTQHGGSLRTAMTNLRQEARGLTGKGFARVHYSHDAIFCNQKFHLLHNSVQ